MFLRVFLRDWRTCARSLDGPVQERVQRARRGTARLFGETTRALIIFFRVLSLLPVFLLVETIVRLFQHARGSVRGVPLDVILAFD